MPADTNIYGKWADTMDVLMSYRYLGCRSELIDADHATGRMSLRTDMRTGAGLLGAPLAIAMLDTAGINIDRIVFGALSHVAIHVYDDSDDVEAVRVDGEVTRLASRAVFTECVMRSDADRSRVIASGTADWVNLGPVAAGFDYTDPGPGVPDEPPMPPLFEAYHIEPAAGGGYVIPRLRPEIGDVLLHHGPNLVALDWHAKDLAQRQAEGAPTALRTYDVRLIRGGTRPPFVTRDLGSGRTGERVWSRAELVDEGGNGDVVSRIHAVHEVVAA